MDVAKAFTFMTEDEGWIRKVGIGAAISLASIFIIPIPLLVGWLVGIARNVKDGMERPLPEWDDLAGLYRDGLAVMTAQIVYTLPFWLVVCIAAIVSVGLGSLSDTNEDIFAAGMVATWGVVACLLILFLIALFFLSPAIVIQYVQTNEFGAAFRFGEVMRIARQNVADILIAALATFGASFVLSIGLGILSVIPCIGQILGGLLGLVVGPYFSAVSGHLYGQIAAKSGGGGHKYDMQLP